MANKAKIHVTGPAHVYVGHKTVGPSNALYIGTCEKSPEIETEYMWEDVLNDVSGSAPMDLVLRGFKSTIGGLFTRFNEDRLLSFIANTGSRVKREAIADLAQPGVYDSGQIGGLTEYTNYKTDAPVTPQNTGYWLAIKFEFAKPTSSLSPIDAILPYGYWFPSVVPSSFTYAQVGTQSKKIQLKVDAHPAIMKPAGVDTDGTNNDQGMTIGDYVVRLFTTDNNIFDFTALPNFD